MSLYQLSVTLHLLAALFWLGGMFFLAAVGAPVLRRVEPESLRAELFRSLGERYRLAGWIAVVVLLVTGTANLHFREILRWELLGEAAFWSTAYGRALAWKLAAVVAMLVLQALHDFAIGPRASRVEPGTPLAASLRRRAAWLARLSAIIGIGLVVTAVRLARGG
ncbi:MAG: DUF4149 domain-containing protein [Gemmatimonadota bacterium]